jgi:hypothetical protein
MLDDPAAQEQIARNRGTASQVLLSTQDVIDLNVEIDVFRSRILDRYREIDRPISMIMSTSMAGPDGDGQAARLNRLWRAGIDRLVRERPHVSTSWLDADHGLVFTHAPEIAQIIRTRTAQPADLPGGWSDAEHR